MKAVKTNTKQAILDSAENLLQIRGFNAFSYQNISAKLGIKNAAIHYHYPSKCDLGIAVIERYHQQFREWLAAHQKKQSCPLTMLRGYFSITLRFLHSHKVCPVGILEAEFHAIPTALQEATRKLDAAIREFLATTLETGRKTGVFYFNGPAEDKALVIGAALQGGLQISRAAGGAVAFKKILRQMERDLGIPSNK